MKRSMVVVLCVIVLGWCGAANGYPTLQLDISGGYYVGGDEETIFASTDKFTLYALLNASAPPTNNNYYISAAVVPRLAESSSPLDLGFFYIDGVKYAVTRDMVYGVPPIEELATAFDAGDLCKHGIFETYFLEKLFHFTATQHTDPYNTQYDPGGIPNQTGYGMLWYAFDIDTSGLATGYQIHFDLYNETVKCGDTDVSKFAPFSHDAQSKVPEPATMLLLGAGLGGLAGIRRRLPKL